MALDDIVARIEGDAAAEAAALLEAARADAERTVAGARSRAEARAARATERARVEAEREAATLLAGARLRARDEALASRRAESERVLEAVEAALVALPDAAYAALLARHVAASALAGDVAYVSAADAARLRAALPDALRAEGAAVPVADEVANDVEHGVVLIGDRTRVEVSPASLVAARREELISAADADLFGAEG